MLNELIALGENEFSKKIVKPLFEKIYNCRVEFTGGGIEKGRDLIVYKKDELGIHDFIGIQVKKIEATPNSQKKSFQQLLTQIEQMKHEGVVDQFTAEKVKFRKLLFITPYQILDRSFDSHLGAFQKVVDLGVTILDGPKVAALIREHLPDLEKTLTGKTIYIENKIKQGFLNSHLMRAMNFVQSKNIFDLFCETNFVAGNKEGSCLRVDVQPGKFSVIKIELPDLEFYIDINSSFQKHLGVFFCDTAKLETIQEKAKSNQALIHEESRYEFENINLRDLIKTKIATSIFRDHFPNLDERATFKRFLEHDYEKCVVTNNKKLFIKEVFAISDLFDTFSSNLIAASDIKKQKVSSASQFEIEVNISDISNKFNTLVSSFILQESSLHENLVSYLNLLINIEKTLPVILIHKTQFEVTPLKEDKNIEKVSISLEKVFDSRLNVMVLGEAGSGKTTNLQIYAQNLYQNKKNDLVIYLTLNHLLSFANKTEEQDVITGLFRYIQTLDCDSYSRIELELLLKNSNSVLILDSVDEAIVSYPWVIDEINRFSFSFPKCQIISSSRYTVKETKQLGFVNVSLLPFDQLQKKMFFNKWFSDEPEKADAIMHHLNENSALNEIVTNPLSATIMSILQSSNVPLPKSEASLYRKRFELLSGLFDRFKGVNRMTMQPETLLKAAQSLAFRMHLKPIRELKKDQILQIISEELSSEYDTSLILEELINPAEILLPNPDGTYSFGHLRFQEYLVSEHLIHVRDFNLYKHIKNSWWEDVFVMYSQHAHDIDWLITDLASNGYVKRTKSLLLKMVKNRNISEQAKLNSRIESALSDELIS
jgi:hypothetical protein